GRQREPGPGRRRSHRRLARLHCRHQGGGGAARRGAAHLGGHGHHGPAERGGAAAHRRAVRRDQGAPARLLPGGGRQPRRGARLGGQDAHHALRHRGGAAGAGRHALADGEGVAPAAAALERAYRDEWTTVVAALSRRLGDLQAAEDAVAEAFTAAATAWRRGGVPPSPGAWLTLTAWRKAVHQLRRDRPLARHGLDDSAPAALPLRLAGVLAVVYLVFNEGYAATRSAAELVRADLCEEAIWLGRLLHRLLPADPETAGLLALMLLHHSRVAARLNADGRPVTLAEQDRARMDRRMIIEGAG